MSPHTLLSRASRLSRRQKKLLPRPRIGKMKYLDPRLARRTEDPRLGRLQLTVDEMSMGFYGVNVPRSKDAVGRVEHSLNQLGNKLTYRLERILRLLRLSEGINSATTLQDALDYLYHSFRSVVPFDRLGCSLLSKDEQTATAVWARSKVQIKALQPGYSAPLAGSSLETVLQTREPRVLNDLESYLEAHPNSKSTRLIVADGMRSSLTCPILAMRRPVGFLFFSSKARDAYRSEHVEFYQQISRVVGSVIERAQLYEDITRSRDELAEANGKLQALVDFDALTKIPNRRAFDRRLAVEWRRAQRSALSLTILMVDADDFKAFNDSYGHLAGDECLKKVAEALAGSLRRAGDFVARFGGEEFAVILPNTDAQQSAVVAERCLEAIRGLRIPHKHARSAPFVTISIGSATWDGVSEADISELLGRADAALYRTKEGGRNASSLASDHDSNRGSNHVGIA